MQECDMVELSNGESFVYCHYSRAAKVGREYIIAPYGRMKIIRLGMVRVCSKEDMEYYAHESELREITNEEVMEILERNGFQ